MTQPRFQRERPCQNLAEVRSLAPKYGKAGASKRNFMISRHFAMAEVRLRRTYRSSAVHQASWAFDPLAWCFPFEIGHSARSASSRHDQALFWKTTANKLTYNVLIEVAYFLPDTIKIKPDRRPFDGCPAGFIRGYRITITVHSLPLVQSWLRLGNHKQACIALGLLKISPS